MRQLVFSLNVVFDASFIFTLGIFMNINVIAVLKKQLVYGRVTGVKAWAAGVSEVFERDNRYQKYAAPPSTYS